MVLLYMERRGLFPLQLDQASSKSRFESCLERYWPRLEGISHHVAVRDWDSPLLLKWSWRQRHQIRIHRVQYPRLILYCWESIAILNKLEQRTDEVKNIFFTAIPLHTPNPPAYRTKKPQKLVIKDEEKAVTSPIVHPIAIYLYEVNRVITIHSSIYSFT